MDVLHDERSACRVVDRESCQLNLIANKVGPFRLAVLFEPVGIHQTRSVFLRMFADGEEEGVVVVHDLPFSQPA